MSHNPFGAGYPLGRRGRILLAAWSLLLAGCFALAAGLEPDPRGFGTHQRLGLPPCTFRVLYDIPCPSCGMTTSFANFTRGRWVRAAEANAAGLLLAFACACQIPWAWISIYRSRLWRVERPDVALLWVLVSLIALCLVQWGLRLAG